jgi:diguanylate cyclase (GGDEF)-like protein
MELNQEAKVSVLVVDDDKLSRVALCHVLQNDYTVHAAANGKEALLMAQELKPDLILLDIIMPGMDGFFVLAALKGTEKTSNIPVICITELNNTADERKGLQLGAVDYIRKPFDEMIIKLRVRHQIRILKQMRTIERLSLIDPLTLIPNRRNFDNHMVIEWGRAVREQHPLSLLFVDIDHFKVYNDVYGHPQGDVALREVAVLLTESLKRTTDFAARWGGEEFVVILPDTSVNGAVKVAEKIRLAAELLEVIFVEKEEITKLTVSIGINTISPEKGDSYDDFISNADKALYMAKNTGRNKVVVFK